MFTVDTPPTIAPISIEDIEAEIGTGQRERLQAMMETEIYQLQEETDRQFCRATLVYTLDRFPACGEIPLWVKPVVSISHIKYYDADNTLTTLSASDYALRTNVSPAVIERPTNVSWPSSLYDRSDAVVITFLAGVTDTAQIPVAAKRAIIDRVKMTYHGQCETEALCRLVSSLKWSGRW